MTDILVDTDILIDLFHQRSDAIEFIKAYEQNSILGISTITQIEIFVGCRNKTEQRKTEKFLRRFEIVPLNETIANNAVALIQAYRLSHGLLMPDAFIAATSLTLNIPLASKNQKHFRYISGLQLIAFPL